MPTRSPSAPAESPTQATRRRLSLAALPLLVAVGVQSAGNLLYHAVVGRALTPDDYGALGAVLSAMTLVAIPLTALQTAAARTSATHGLGRATARRAVTTTAAWFVLAGGALLAISPLVASYLRLPTTGDAMLLAPTLVVAGLLAVSRGLLLGVSKVGTVASSYVVGTGVRLAVGIGLTWTAGVTGALVGTLVGEVVALALLGVSLRRRPQGVVARVSVRDVLVAGGVVTGLFLFTTIDLLLARHHLPGWESGGYVAAATIGKTVLALPGAAVSVAYPRLVAAWGSERARRTLLAALAVVAVPGLLGALVVALLPGTVLSLLYGPDSYTWATGVVQVLAAVAGLSAVVSALTHAALARRSAAALLPWAGAGLEVAVIETWHASATQVATGSALALAGVLLALVVTEGRAWGMTKTASALPSA